MRNRKETVQGGHGGETGNGKAGEERPEKPQRDAATEDLKKQKKNL